jgi:pimeloyl-ACP methyl ester carboxylesterase
LHGYSFTSDVWREINLLELLEEEGISFAALDMPYGMRSKCSPKSRDPEANALLIRDLASNLFGNTEPIIVGASLGGYMALKYAIEHHPRGLLLIAPVNTGEKDLLENYSKIDVPVRIVYGSKDRIVSQKEMEALCVRLPKCKLSIYPGAKHPAYLPHPEEFKREVLKIYEEANQRPEKG